MAQTALSPRRVRALGAYTELVVGVVSILANGTTTLTLPQFSQVLAVVVSGSTSDKVSVATSISDNVITFDAESATTVSAYLAYGIGRN